MQVRLTKPELAQFIDAQVKAGNFTSPEAAVEAAVEQMMLDSSPLDQATVDALNEADEQIDRGEGIDFETFAADMRKKLNVR